MADRPLLRRAVLIALAVAVLLCCAGVFQHGLWTPDEPREAEVGREMLLAKFSAAPTLGGRPFLEKPPLGAWCSAASFAVFGVNDAAARVPSTLFAVGAVLVAYLLGKRAAGRFAGLCTAVVVATMWQFSDSTHRGVLDVALTFFVAAGHLAFLSLWKSDRRSAAPYVAIGASAGLAFLTKGFVGPGLACAPPILAAAALRDREYVKRVLPRAFVAAVLGLAVFGGPWVYALVHTEGAGWPALKTCLWTNTVARSVGDGRGGIGGHAHWPGYYLTSLVLTTAPWCLAAPAAWKSGALGRSRRGGRAAFCGLVFLLGVLLLSLPSGKRDLYLVPLLPMAAVVPGVWLSRVGTRGGGVWDAVTLRAVGGIATALFVAIGLAMGYVAFGLPMPSFVDPSAREALSAEKRTVLVVMVAVGVWVLGPHAWVKRRVVPRAARGLHVAAGVVLLYLVVHAAAYPLLDPFRNMSEGSRRIAALVPPQEKFVILDSDETTVSVVPFYSGRILVDIAGKAGPEKLLKMLDSGETRHFVVMQNDRDKLTPALRERVELVETVRVSASRDVDVYALKR
jgi:4-amino-4-deoxy-L-arabinose transferase-like glycosyltransferase